MSGAMAEASSATTRIHWVRHAKVASHRGDLPLTDEGRREVERAGQQFSRICMPGEVVSILHAPTQRTRETALVLYSSMARALGDVPHPTVALLAPVENMAVRNPDIYVAGARVELVSTAQALAEQIPSSGLGPEQLALLPFFQGFWSVADRIGYWVNHLNPPGEDADAVARRLLTFARSLLDLPREQPRRYICVTHSPTMRAFLRRYLLGEDPGEPDYLEAVDLSFASDGSLSLCFREHSTNILWPP
jgi:broad specificity phosphatase PhoE